MKKLVLFLFSVLFLLTSCSKKDASSALPKQVDALAVLNLAQIYQKADLDPAFLAQLGDDWRAVLENPAETGINWESPVYLYMTDNTQGIVASISSVGKLSQCLMQYGFKVTEADNYTWASNGNYLLGFNDNVLVGNNIYGDEKLFRQRIRKQLEQDEDRSFSSTEDYAQLMSKQTDVACFFPAGLVMSLLKENLPMVPEMSFEDMNCLLSMQFDKGMLTSGMQLLARSEEANEALELLKASLTPVQGTFVNSIPEGSSLFFTVGTNGQQLLKLIQQNRGIGMLLTLISQAVPVDELLQAQQGDVAVSMSGARNDSMLLFAQMNDTELLKSAQVWTDGGRAYGIRSLGNQQFSANLDGVPMFFGAKENQLYVTNAMNLVQDVKPDAAIQALKSQITGSYGYIRLDLKQMMQSAQLPSAYRQYLSWMDQLTVRAVSPDQYELQLASTNTNDNILKTILQCIRP